MQKTEAASSGADDGGENFAASTGTIGRQGLSSMLPGAEDMMSEMARKLQERRRKADEGAASGVRKEKGDQYIKLLSLVGVEYSVIKISSN